MEFENLLFKKEGNIGILSINNPKTLNALNYDTLKEIDLAINLVENDEEIYVLIISGEGKAFVAGADIGEMKDFNSIEGRNFGKFGSEVFRKIELMEKPVIGAINGFALGGGCELAMACDIRIAGERAKFGQPEVTLGITPGFGGTQRLARLVGIAKAKELIYTGDIINAEEALQIGLVNKVCSGEDLMDEALEMANKIAAASQVAVRYSKTAINASSDTNIDTGLAFEKDVFGLCFGAEDQKEGMEAFLDKRKANFKNK